MIKIRLIDIIVLLLVVCISVLLYINYILVLQLI